MCRSWFLPVWLYLYLNTESVEKNIVLDSSRAGCRVTKCARANNNKEQSCCLLGSDAVYSVARLLTTAKECAAFIIRVMVTAVRTSGALNHDHISSYNSRLQPLFCISQVFVSSRLSPTTVRAKLLLVLRLSRPWLSNYSLLARDDI